MPPKVKKLPKINNPAHPNFRSRAASAVSNIQSQRVAPNRQVAKSDEYVGVDESTGLPLGSDTTWTEGDPPEFGSQSWMLENIGAIPVDPFKPIPLGILGSNPQDFPMSQERQEWTEERAAKEYKDSLPAWQKALQPVAGPFQFALNTLLKPLTLTMVGGRWVADQVARPMEGPIGWIYGAATGDTSMRMGVPVSTAPQVELFPNAPPPLDYAEAAKGIYTFGEVLHDYNVWQSEDDIWKARALGLTGDILFDPLTFIGSVGKGFKLAAGIGSPQAAAKVQRTVVREVIRNSLDLRGGATINGQVVSQLDLFAAVGVNPLSDDVMTKIVKSITDVIPSGTAAHGIYAAAPKGNVAQAAKHGVTKHGNDFLVDLAVASGVSGPEFTGKFLYKVSGKVAYDLDTLAVAAGKVKKGGAHALADSELRTVARIVQEGRLDTAFREPLAKGYKGAWIGSKQEVAELTYSFGWKVPLTGPTGRILRLHKLQSPIGIKFWSKNTRLPFVGTWVRGIPQGFRTVFLGKSGYGGKIPTTWFGYLKRGGRKIQLRKLLHEQIKIAQDTTKNLKFQKGRWEYYTSGSAARAATKEAASADDVVRAAYKEVQDITQTIHHAGRGDAMARTVKPKLAQKVEQFLQDVIGYTPKPASPRGAPLYADLVHAMQGDVAAIELVGEEVALKGRTLMADLRDMVNHYAGEDFLGESAFYFPRELSEEAQLYLHANSGGLYRPKHHAKKPYDMAGYEQSRNYLSAEELAELVKAEMKKTGASEADTLQALMEAGRRSDFMGEPLFAPKLKNPHTNQWDITNPLNPEGVSVENQIADMMMRQGIDYNLFSEDLPTVLYNYIDVLAKRAGEVHAEVLLKRDGVFLSQYATLIHIPDVAVSKAIKTVRETEKHLRKASAELEIALIQSTERYGGEAAAMRLQIDELEHVAVLAEAKYVGAVGRAHGLQQAALDAEAHVMSIDRRIEEVNARIDEVEQRLNPKETELSADELIRLEKERVELNEELMGMYEYEPRFEYHYTKLRAATGAQLQMEAKLASIFGQQDEGGEEIFNHLARLFDDHIDFEEGVDVFAMRRAADDTVPEFQFRVDPATQDPIGWQVAYKDGFITDDQMRVIYQQLDDYVSELDGSGDMALGEWLGFKMHMAASSADDAGGLFRSVKAAKELLTDQIHGNAALNEKGHLWEVEEFVRRFGNDTISGEVPSPENVSAARVHIVEQINALWDDAVGTGDFQNPWTILLDDPNFSAALATYYGTMGDTFVGRSIANAGELKQMVESAKVQLREAYQATEVALEGAPRLTVSVADQGGLVHSDFGIEDYVFLKSMSDGIAGAPDSMMNPFPPTGLKPDDIFSQGQVIQVGGLGGDATLGGSNLAYKVSMLVEGDAVPKVVYIKSGEISPQYFYSRNPANVAMDVRGQPVVRGNASSSATGSDKIGRDALPWEYAADKYFDQLDPSLVPEWLRLARGTSADMDAERLRVSGEFLADRLYNDLDRIQGGNGYVAPRSGWGRYDGGTVRAVQGQEAEVQGGWWKWSDWEDDYVPLYEPYTQTNADEMYRWQHPQTGEYHLVQFPEGQVPEGAVPFHDLMSEQVMMDMLLGATDVIGADAGANVGILKSTGRIFRLDNGATFHYRAKGAPKDHFRGGTNAAREAEGDVFQLYNWRIVPELFGQAGEQSGKDLAHLPLGKRLGSMFDAEQLNTYSNVGQTYNKILEGWAAKNGTASEMQRQVEQLLVLREYGWGNYVAKQLPDLPDAEIAMFTDWLETRTRVLAEHVGLPWFEGEDLVKQILARDGLSAEVIERGFAETPFSARSQTAKKLGLPSWLSPDGQYQAAIWTSLEDFIPSGKVAKELSAELETLQRSGVLERMIRYGRGYSGASIYPELYGRGGTSKVSPSAVNKAEMYDSIWFKDGDSWIGPSAKYSADEALADDAARSVSEAQSHTPSEATWRGEPYEEPPFDYLDYEPSSLQHDRINTTQADLQQQFEQALDEGDQDLLYDLASQLEELEHAVDMGLPPMSGLGEQEQLVNGLTKLATEGAFGPKVTKMIDDGHLPFGFPEHADNVQILGGATDAYGQRGVVQEMTLDEAWALVKHGQTPEGMSEQAWKLLSEFTPKEAAEWEAKGGSVKTYLLHAMEEQFGLSTKQAEEAVAALPEYGLSIGKPSAALDATLTKYNVIEEIVAQGEGPWTTNTGRFGVAVFNADGRLRVMLPIDTGGTTQSGNWTVPSGWTEPNAINPIESAVEGVYRQTGDRVEIVGVVPRTIDTPDGPTNFFVGRVFNEGSVSAPLPEGMGEVPPTLKLLHAAQRQRWWNPAFGHGNPSPAWSDQVAPNATNMSTVGSTGGHRAKWNRITLDTKQGGDNIVIYGVPTTVRKDLAELNIRMSHAEIPTVPPNSSSTNPSLQHMFPDSEYAKLESAQAGILDELYTHGIPYGGDAPEGQLAAFADMHFDMLERVAQSGDGVWDRLVRRMRDGRFHEEGTYNRSAGSALGVEVGYTAAKPSPTRHWLQGKYPQVIAATIDAVSTLSRRTDIPLFNSMSWRDKITFMMFMEKRATGPHKLDLHFPTRQALESARSFDTVVLGSPAGARQLQPFIDHNITALDSFAIRPARIIDDHVTKYIGFVSDMTGARPHLYWANRQGLERSDLGRQFVGKDSIVNEMMSGLGQSDPMKTFAGSTRLADLQKEMLVKGTSSGGMLKSTQKSAPYARQLFDEAGNPIPIEQLERAAAPHGGTPQGEGTGIRRYLHERDMARFYEVWKRSHTSEGHSAVAWYNYEPIHAATPKTILTSGPQAGAEAVFEAGYGGLAGTRWLNYMMINPQAARPDPVAVIDAHKSLATGTPLVDQPAAGEAVHLSPEIGELARLEGDPRQLGGVADTEKLLEEYEALMRKTVFDKDYGHLREPELEDALQMLGHEKARAQVARRDARLVLDDAQAQYEEFKTAVIDPLAEAARQSGAAKGQSMHNLTLIEERLRRARRAVEGLEEFKRIHMFPEGDEVGMLGPGLTAGATLPPEKQGLNNIVKKFDNINVALDNLIDADLASLNAAQRAAVSELMKGFPESEVKELLQQSGHIISEFRDAAGRIKKPLDGNDFWWPLKKFQDREEILDQILISGYKPFGVTSQGPENIVEAMTAITRFRASGGWGGFLRQYDKLHSLMKGYMIAKPGFHARNYFSGVFMNFLHGVRLSSYRRFQNAYWRYQHDYAVEQGLTHRAKTVQNAMKVRGIWGKANAEHVAIIRQMDEGGILVGGHGQVFAETGEGAGKMGRSGFNVKRIASMINPFNPRNLPLQLSRNVGMGTETFLRGTMGFDVILRDGTVDEAFESIIKFHFDYDDLNDIERLIIKRIVPFYTWTKNAMPLMIEQVGQNPAKMSVYLKAKRNMEMGQDTGGIKPNYFIRQGAIQLPFKYKGENMFVLPDLPFKTPLEMIDPALALRTDMSLVERLDTFMGSVGTQITPLIKAPYEWKSKQNLWKGYSFDGRYEQVPTAYEIIPALMPLLATVGLAEKQNNVWLMRDYNLHTMAQLLPTFTDARRLFPSEERYQQRTLSTWMSFVFGMGIRTNTLDEQRRVIESMYWETVEEQQDMGQKMREARNPNP